jgi:hypothetical protein
LEVDGVDVGSAEPADGCDDPQAPANRHDAMSTDVKYRVCCIQL